MDLQTLKLLATGVRALLEQSNHRIGHNQSLDLIAALPGLRSWPEVMAFPDRVAACKLGQASAASLASRIKHTFGLDLSAPSLLSSLIQLTPMSARESFYLVDEFWSNVGAADDRLKEDLRDIEGVPKTSYLVRDGQVFVFDKLVHDVKAQAGARLGDHLPELAAQLLPKAMVSPHEAVKRWGLIPRPYECLPSASGEFSIRHRAFNARIPGAFLNEHDVQRALARLIVGDVQPGSGDFTYRGQPMILCDPLNAALLPLRPKLPAFDGPAPHRYAALAHADYLPGFDPISELLFAEIKELEADWGRDSERCTWRVHARIAELWSRTGELQSQLASLNQLREADTIPGYAQEDLAELRPLYPELSMLSDGALFSMFDNYQMECCYINGWTASRDSDFLLYLLGYVAGGLASERAKDVGEWVAAAVLDGSTFDSAKAFGLACDRYDSDIARLARRVAEAMTFLASDKDAIILQGHEITTAADRFRQARSMNGGTVIFEQDVADLSATDTPRG